MRYFLAVLCLVVACGVARGQSTDAADKAQALAAEGKWAEAMESYGDFLKGLSAEQYRDKKDFSWIVEECQKNGKDLAGLKQAAEEELAKHPKDNLFTWRLHRMLGEMAEKSGDKEALKKELDLAIASYPAKVDGDPSKHSSLQHLYNERALLATEKDVKSGEDYILRAFKEDKRFVYFFGTPWEQALGAREYAKMMGRVVKVYEEKAASNPVQRSILNRYAAEARRTANEGR